MRRVLSTPLLLAASLASASCAPGSSTVRPTPHENFPESTKEQESPDLPVAAQDVQILERADRLLSSESIWNRADTRDCPPEATQLSLFCALHRACIQVLGQYDHRRAALQVVRFVIQERGKDYEHRLMDFNNDPSTSFTDVKAVLRIAADRIRGRLKPS